jgi:hypothetical protein
MRTCISTEVGYERGPLCILRVTFDRQLITGTDLLRLVSGLDYSPE